MSGYDRQIRPQIAGPPLEVEVNVAIRSMGPVDEKSQTFALGAVHILHRLKADKKGEFIALDF